MIQHSWFSWFCLLPVCICVSRSRNWEFQCKGFECPAVSLCPVRLTAFGSQGVRRSWQWQLAKGKWRRQQHEIQERSHWEGAALWSSNMSILIYCLIYLIYLFYLCIFYLSYFCFTVSREVVVARNTAWEKVSANINQCILLKAENLAINIM